MHAPRLPRRAPHRPGFTLVEIMVVLIIIGILAAIAVPAVNFAITQGTNAAMRMEVNSLDAAVNQYQLKYGDYPPDGSSWSVMQRHMRKAFPRMGEPDNTLLTKMTHVGTIHSPVAMDRAEALVFFLGGFSSDPAHPLTGAGGPLEFIGPGADKLDLNNYQYNATRDNAFYEFEPERLTLAYNEAAKRSHSDDEARYNVNDALHGRLDLLPAYLVDGGETPILYFDSRTYGDVGGAYNGFLLPNYGGVRPYKTRFDAQPPRGGSAYATVKEAFDAIKFVNADSFQIISPGRDNLYGSLVTNPNDSSLPVHYVVETGKAFSPTTSASNVDAMQVGTIEGYQEVGVVPGVTVNGHLDNITNFSDTTLEGDLAE